ncbi:MAG: right-handed parallel beta-helix repeat-containing protein [Bifidobacteriaceae bacterium]|nr:right-handed parallel beta-helix repeat-containing protein [Bifidobacteriaceae bacterium]
MVSIEGGAKNITIDRYTMGRFADLNGGMIRIYGTATAPVENLTISNVIFDNQPAAAAGASCDANNSNACAPTAIGFGTSANGGSVNGLPIVDCTFNYFRDARPPLYLTFTTGSANWNIDKNTFTNVGASGEYTSSYYGAIRLPFETTLGGKNYIQNNTFDNSTATLPGYYAISWRGNLATSATTPSNLTIRDNTFDGYRAQSIFMNSVGTVTMERNEIGTASSSRPHPNTNLEETSGEMGGPGLAMVMNYNYKTNRRIQTWYPTAASVARCALEVDVTPPAGVIEDVAGVPNLPVRLDFYYTVDDTAELFLGSVERTTSEPTTVTLADLPPGPGYIRLQTQGAPPVAGGQMESSQYSRAVEVADPAFCSVPDIAIDLRAWRGVDPQRSDHDTIVNEASEVENDTYVWQGEPIWLTYTVTNTGWVDLADVAVLNEQGAEVCTLAVLPAQDTAGCSVLREPAPD